MMASRVSEAMKRSANDRGSRGNAPAGIQSLHIVQLLNLGYEK